jgi:hypothetical protein
MRIFSLLLLFLLLAGCADGPKPRMFPPGASLQELRVQADGQWVLALLLQNNARLGIRVSGVEGVLLVDGVEAARLSPTLDLGIAANGVERVELQVAPSAAAAARVTAALANGRGVSYVIEGHLRTSEPGKRQDPFRFESRLSPTPGLTGTLR